MLISSTLLTWQEFKNKSLPKWELIGKKLLNRFWKMPDQTGRASIVLALPHYWKPGGEPKFNQSGKGEWKLISTSGKMGHEETL